MLQGLCHHYVTTVLPLPSRRGDEFQRLWLEATSLAAVQLLRCVGASPGSAPTCGHGATSAIDSICFALRRALTARLA